jgi:hypothetical protein
MVRNSTEGTPNICRKKSFYAFDLYKNADLFSPQKDVVFHDVTEPLEHEIFFRFRTTQMISEHRFHELDTTGCHSIGLSQFCSEFQKTRKMSYFA